MVTSTNQPTDNRAKIEQSAFSKVRKYKKGRDLQYHPNLGGKNLSNECIFMPFFGSQRVLIGAMNRCPTNQLSLIARHMASYMISNITFEITCIFLSTY